MQTNTIIPSWSAALGLLCLAAIPATAAGRKPAKPAAPAVQQEADAQKLQYAKSSRQAQSKAKADKKIIFFLFTNERTCQPCKMLEAQILSKPEFAQELQKIAVPVKYTFQNMSTEGAKLLSEYRVGGPPCIIYTDASG